MFNHNWTQKQTVRWIFGLILQLISILLSSYSTIALPLKAAQLVSHKNTGNHARTTTVLCIVAKMWAHIAFQSSTAYFTLHLLIKSERFAYLRKYNEKLLGSSMIPILNGLCLSLVFPGLLFLQHFFAMLTLKLQMKNFLSKAELIRDHIEFVSLREKYINLT